MKIIAQTSIMMETVEMLYKYVNNLTVDNIKRDFFLRYGEQLSPQDRQFNEELFQALGTILEEGTQGIDRGDARLQYFFQDLLGDRDHEWACLAKIMLYSFYEGEEFSLDESLSECRRRYAGFAKDGFSHFKIIGIDKAGLNYIPISGDQPEPLYRQLESFELPGGCKWEIYQSIMEYDSLMGQLEDLIRPVALRLEKILLRYDNLLQQTVRYWEEYFSSHSFWDCKAQMMGVETDAEDSPGDEEVVWFWWMGFGQLHFYQSPGRQALNIGILVRAGTTPKSAGYAQENVLNILKFLSDKSKFGIIRKLSEHSYYGLELANEMGLTSGTISKHLGALFSYGLLNLQRVNNRVYYRTDVSAVRKFLQQLEEGLLGPQDTIL